MRNGCGENTFIKVNISKHFNISFKNITATWKKKISPECMNTNQPKHVEKKKFNERKSNFSLIY